VKAFGKAAFLSGMPRGSTLLELLMALSMLAVVLAVLLGFSESGALWWKRLEREMEVRDNLRISLDLIGRELAGAGGIAGLAGDSLYFYDHAGSRFRYYVDYDPRLKLYALRRYAEGSGSSVPVGLHLKPQGLKVEYYDGDLQIPAGQYGTYDPARVTLVKISLTGNSGGLEDITYTTAVKLRGR